ncbi:uncharacterized protein LOC111906026 [Lactuca sativa]|uniref:Uncharacterized protein n=1 Tax=Lactuca sativa TaxID=4236 RepID=A0A9R1X2V1_LACSA|nr:uncharacterized protein LOC111906026 [Lactuca sativa]KAJ0198580.1 hypothetical protein LSAT_V11C700347020 [Lactuca sativa]
MKCKKHYADLSSVVGVCASCLRERLFSLVAAQEQAQAKAQSQDQTVEEKNRNLDTHPVFPRSVSPYISRRKSDNSAASTAAAAWPNSNQHNSERNRHRSVPDQRFFSTPQVGPTVGCYNPCRKKKHSFIRFSLLTNLFRSKKRNEVDLDSDPRVSVSNYGGSYGGGDSVTSAMPSPSWFSTIRSGGGCRKKQPFCFNESSNSAASVMRKHYREDRGMSPVRYSDAYGGVEDEFGDGSSGYESCESRKQTPWRTPAHPSVRRGGGGHGKNVSGLTFCLSPLVRASPNRHWNHKGMPPVDGGEIRAPVKPHLSNTKTFCANRSKKLADLGRLNTTR